MVQKNDNKKLLHLSHRENDSRKHTIKEPLVNDGESVQFEVSGM